MEPLMAELQQQVQCPLCNETLFEPKLLQCYHTFCKMCIKGSTQLDGQKPIFKCPQCTSQTLFQELDDVEDLQISPIHSRMLQVLLFIESQKVCSVNSRHSEALFHCAQCNRSLCEECLGRHLEHTKNHEIVSLSDLKKKDVEMMLKRETHCKIHSDQDVELHCQDCKDLICFDCWKDHNKSHKIEFLKEFIDAKKEFLSKQIQEIQKLNTNEVEKKKQEEIAMKIKSNGEIAQKQVKKKTKMLIKALIDNEQKLLNEIQESITKADRNLRIIRHTPAAKEYIETIINNGTAGDVIDSMETNASNCVYIPFPSNSLGLSFCPNENLFQQVNNGLGELKSLQTVDPKMSSIKVETDIEVMKKAKLILKLEPSEGETAYELIDNVEVLITPEEDVKVEEKHVICNGEIAVEFTPCVAGELKIQAHIRGSHVSNSPKYVTINPQLFKEVNTQCKLKGALNTGSKNFNGIAVNRSNSKIAVVDHSSHCVRVLNMEGELLSEYGSEGSEQGQLQSPYGIAFLNEKDLVIADQWNHRICIVDTTSGNTETFGSLGNGNGQFNCPMGVHVDKDSNIIICDRNNHRVQVFTSKGDYQYHFIVPNTCPLDVVKHKEMFYVIDCNSSGINVIEMTGNQTPTTKATMDRKDICGQVKNPIGLAIDNDNNLLVSGNYGYSMIQKFTLDGRFIGKSNQLSNSPRFMVILNDGRMICTTGNGVVFLGI